MHKNVVRVPDATEFILQVVKMNLMSCVFYHKKRGRKNDLKRYVTLEIWHIIGEKLKPQTWYDLVSHEWRAGITCVHVLLYSAWVLNALQLSSCLSKRKENLVKKFHKETTAVVSGFD